MGVQSLMDFLLDPNGGQPEKFHVYDHHVVPDRHPHRWSCLGHRPTLAEAIAYAEGRTTHAVVLDHGRIVFDNLRPPEPRDP